MFRRDSADTEPRNKSHSNLDNNICTNYKLEKNKWTQICCYFWGDALERLGSKWIKANWRWLGRDIKLVNLIAGFNVYYIAFY